MDEFFKTWRDIVQLALAPPADPMTLNPPSQALIYQAVRLVEAKRITEHEALIGLVLALAEMSQAQHQQIMEWLNTRSRAPFLIPKEAPTRDHREAMRLALAALQRVEWTPDLDPASPVCYWCRGYKRPPAMDQDYYGKAGHKHDCPRQRAMTALEAVLSGAKEGS